MIFSLISKVSIRGTPPIPYPCSLAKTALTMSIRKLWSSETMINCDVLDFICFSFDWSLN